MTQLEQELFDALCECRRFVDLSDDQSFRAYTQAGSAIDKYLETEMAGKGREMTRKFALVSTQGTACPETVLLEHEYTPENKAKIEAWSQSQHYAHWDRPVLGSWTEVTDNDAC